MASQMFELLQNGDLSSDVNTSRAVRVFTTFYQSFAAMQADERFPKIGSVHPNFPNIRADRHDVAFNQDGTIVLTVPYSNDGSGKISFNNYEDDEYFRWGYGAFSSDEVVPQYVAAEKVVSQGATSRVIRVWEEAPIERCTFKRVDATLVATVIVPKLSIQQVLLINKQVGRIHQIPLQGGDRFVFQAPDITARDNNFDRVSYTWLSDSGTLYPDDLPFQSSPKSYVFPPSIQIGADPTFYIRPPFWDIVPIPPPALQEGQTQQAEPTFGYKKRNTQQLNGWINFPGMDRA